MKYLGLTLIFLLWCIVTIVAIASIIGTIVLAEETEWFDIPSKLINKFEV